MFQNEKNTYSGSQISNTLPNETKNEYYSFVFYNKMLQIVHQMCKSMYYLLVDTLVYFV